MKRNTIILGISLLACLAGCGRQGKNKVFGKLAYVTGTAQIFSKGAWQQANNDSPILSGDSIRTSKESEAVITFGNSSIKLSENTSIAINDTINDKNKRLIAVLNTSGEVLSDVKDAEKSADYEVWTPTAAAHAEGTHFIVSFMPGPYVTHVRVLDGRVRVFNPFLPTAPPVLVPPGCYTTVSYNAAPVPVAAMNYGQFKKMQRILGPRYYDNYQREFRINPEQMEMDAPIVVVPILPPPVFFPPPPGFHHGDHGRVFMPAPFLLPPGPGMPFPPAPHGGMFPPPPPLPGMPPVPHAVHGGMTPPMPPRPPMPSMPRPVHMVAPSPFGPVPVVHEHQDHDRGRHEGNYEHQEHDRGGHEGNHDHGDRDHHGDHDKHGGKKK
jgi:hypothetical protein